MGLNFSYGHALSKAEGDRADPRGGGARRHLLRHRRDLRPLHQRGDGRRGAGAGARPGGDRHQVRLQHRPGDRQAGRHGQPARAYPRGRRRVAEAAGRRGHRPVLPAPRRSRRADRGRGGRGPGPDRRRQGQAFRPVRARRADDPPRPCGAAGHRDPERIFAVDARAGDQRHAAGLRGAWHRLRALQPARQGLPDRRHEQGHQARRGRFPPASCRASRRRRWRRTRRWSIC